MTTLNNVFSLYGGLYHGLTYRARHCGGVGVADNEATFQSLRRRVTRRDRVINEEDRLSLSLRFKHLSPACASLHNSDMWQFQKSKMSSISRTPPLRKIQPICKTHIYDHGLIAIKDVRSLRVNIDRALIFGYDLHEHFMQLILKFGQYLQHSLFIT